MINRLLCFGMLARVIGDACNFLIAKASLASDDPKGNDAVERDAQSSVDCLVVLLARKVMLGILLLYLKQVAIALMVFG